MKVLITPMYRLLQYLIENKLIKDHHLFNQQSQAIVGEKEQPKEDDDFLTNPTKQLEAMIRRTWAKASGRKASYNEPEMHKWIDDNRFLFSSIVKSVEQPTVKEGDLQIKFNTELRLIDGQFCVFVDGEQWIKKSAVKEEGQEELWEEALKLINNKTDFRQSSDGKLKGLGNRLLEAFHITRRQP